MSALLVTLLGVPRPGPTVLRGAGRQRPDPAQAALIVCLFGELDLATAEQLRPLVGMAETCPEQTMVVDMSAVSFIDAHCIGLIVRAYEAAQQRGRVLRVVGLHGLPARVFRLLGLEQMLVQPTGRATCGRDPDGR